MANWQEKEEGARWFHFMLGHHARENLVMGDAEPWGVHGVNGSHRQGTSKARRFPSPINIHRPFSQRVFLSYTGRTSSS